MCQTTLVLPVAVFDCRCMHCQAAIQPGTVSGLCPDCYFTAVYEDADWELPLDFDGCGGAGCSDYLCNDCGGLGPDTAADDVPLGVPLDSGPDDYCPLCGDHRHASHPGCPGDLPF